MNPIHSPRAVMHQRPLLRSLRRLLEKFPFEVKQLPEFFKNSSPQRAGGFIPPVSG
jgi:hypothetical protein